MIFKVYRPSAVLQPFIRCYLGIDTRHCTASGAHTLFPNGFSGIFFNFGNIGSLIIKEEIKTPPVSIFGQIDRHFTAAHQSGFYSLGVLLHPTILSSLLRIDMSELTNTATDGRLLLPELSILHERMEEEETVESKIRHLENYFTVVLCGHQKSISLSDKALSLLHQKNVISVEQIAKTLQTSQRNLEISFKRTVGLSPKTYSLIVRFKRMEQQLKTMPVVHWQDMAFAHEYYDQNHFIKDFRRFTGFTPSQYLLEDIEAGRSYLTAR